MADLNLRQDEANDWDPRPIFQVVPFIHHVTKDQDGVTENLNVDGSTTPVDFISDAIPSDQIWYCSSIGIYLYDNNIFTSNNFGSITNGLTTGIKVKVKLTGTTYEISWIKDNQDMINEFNVSSYTPVVVQGDQLISNYMKFDTPLTLKGSSSDQIIITVNDNLTQINNIHFIIQTWRVI